MSAVKNILESVKFFLIGLVTTIVLITFTVLSSPIYFYRFLLINYISKINFLRPPSLRKPVTLFGNMTALEFWGDKQNISNKLVKSPRNVIVLSFVVRGTVTSDELKQQIKTRWLEATDPLSGQLLYPEFYQYIDSWLGFMFWYQETQFNLNDHLKNRLKPWNSEPFYSEKFLCKLMERLLNKPFKYGKSPWEFHIIRNYGQEGKNTAFVLRIHHGLADGYAIIRCLLDGILEYEQLDVLNKVISQSNDKTKIQNSSFTKILRLPLRFISDLGYLGSLYLRNRTFLHVFDSDKQWYQLYVRSNFISVSKIKMIKNKFGVSFTSVLLSALSKGLNKLEKMKRSENVLSNVPFLFLLPVKNHSKRLTNDFTATILDLPLNSNLKDSVSSLVNMENLLQNGKGSLIPLISRWILPPAALAQLAPIAKTLTHNYIVPCGLTSLRTSDLGILEWKGREILECDFAVGGALGVTGMAFMVQSYGNQTRFGITAEMGLVTRQELEIFAGWVENEIEILYNI